MPINLLYISYYFPPIKSIAVKRNYFFATGLQKYFKDVNVLTTSNQNILDQEDMPQDGLIVKSLITFDYRTIISKFRKTKKSHFSEEQKSGWLIKLLIRVNESFPFNLLIGEGGLIFIINGYRSGLKVLQNTDEKYMITSYRPFANVFIGYLLKRRIPETIWVINLHDFPMDRIRNNTVILSAQRWIWSKMLKEANHCITVSEGIRNHIIPYQTRVSAILNGVSVRKSKNASNKKFRISYTGSLYRNFSKPDILFQSISDLIASSEIRKDDIEIVYAGKDTHYWMSVLKNFGLVDFSVNLGDLSSQEAMDVQDMGNINIILSWSSEDQSGIITGKFYEYLGSTNPILFIINGVMDNEILKIFEHIGCGKVVATNDKNAMDDIKSFILKNYADWTNKHTFSSYESSLEHLSWDKQIKKLYEIMLSR